MRVWTVVVAALALGLVAISSPAQSVQEDLQEEQDCCGLALLRVRYDGISILGSDHRVVAKLEFPEVLRGKATYPTISPDGRLIALSLPEENVLATYYSDGSLHRKYPDIRNAVTFCFSSDATRLAVTTWIRRDVYTRYTINTETGDVRQIPSTGRFHQPCWSADNRRVVVEDAGNVKILDTETGHAETIGTGSDPYWVYGEEKIVFREGKSHITFDLRSRTRSKLPIKGKYQLVLLPDTRFIGYISPTSFWESIRLGWPGSFYDTTRLRVMRLRDKKQHCSSVGLATRTSRMATCSL